MRDWLTPREPLELCLEMVNRMNFKLEEFNRTSNHHIGIINQWWEKVEDHNFSKDSPFSQILPTDHGFMVFHNEDPICSIFLYPIYGSQIAIIGFPISNTLADKEVRREALSLLVAGVEAKAKALQYKFLFSYAGNMVAKQFFGRFGFKSGNENITNFVKKL